SATGGTCSPNQSPHTAPSLVRLPYEIEITDRTHPFFGRRLPVVYDRAPGMRDSVLVQLPDGQRRAVRRAATSLVPSPVSTDPPLLSPAPISVRTLLPLARRVHRLKGREAEVPDATARHPASPSPPLDAPAGHLVATPVR